MRVYVPVEVAFTATGEMRPRTMTWEDGRKFDIDRVFDIKPSFAMKAGSSGDRYTVEIRNKRTFLFFEHNPKCGQLTLGRWFIEKEH